MAIEKVRAYFRSIGLEERIQEFEVSSATVELAASALGVAPCRIAKTLSFVTPKGCLLVVAAGDAKIDNAKYKAQFSCKASMPPREACEELTGHPAGGICPFCNPPEVAVYLDASLRRFDTIYPACGSANSAVMLSCEELQRCAGAVAWVDVCKGWA